MVQDGIVTEHTHRALLHIATGKDALGAAWELVDDSSTHSNELLSETRTLLEQSEIALASVDIDVMDICGNLANMLYKCYQSTGHSSCLSATIDLQREVLDLCPPEHSDRGKACSNLALSLSIRSKITRDSASLLNEVMTLKRESVRLCPPEHPDHMVACTNLALSLLDNFNITGDVSMLTEAISLQRESVALCMPDHCDRALICGNLALALWTRFSSTGDGELLTEIIDLQRESLDLCTPEDTNRRVFCTNLANSVLARFRGVGDPLLLLEAISLQRESLVLCPSEHHDRALICGNLAQSLRTRFDMNGDRALLTEVIDLQRESLALCAPGHPNYALSCSNLANSLLEQFNSDRDMTLLTESITLQRESLMLCPAGHPQRATISGNLARSLWTCFNVNGDDALLTEVIDLQQELLAMCAPGHPDRGVSCSNLAHSLLRCFNSSGDMSLLISVIALQRESLSLCPTGHPQRAMMYGNLALSLWTKFYVTGGDALMRDECKPLVLIPQGHLSQEETNGNFSIFLTTRADGNDNDMLSSQVIDPQHQSRESYSPGSLKRGIDRENLTNVPQEQVRSTGDEPLSMEVFPLRRECIDWYPVGHPYRAISCMLLGSMLFTRFNDTGDELLLTEAVSLQRESLRLLPPSDTALARCCVDLAISLYARFNITRDPHLLREAIHLQRKSLSLCPSGHSFRAAACSNLALSIWTLYEYTHLDSFLTQAIALQRETLGLLSPSDPNRGSACGNLALSLRTLFQKTGDHILLSESIDLQRESLQLCPPSYHPSRSLCCTNLAYSLAREFDRTGDDYLADEIHASCLEALSLANSGAKSIPANILACLYLHPHSKFHDIGSAIQYISLSLDEIPGKVYAAVGASIEALSRFWTGVKATDLKMEYHMALIPIYQKLIRLLPFVSNPILHAKMQLWALSHSKPLGGEAFVNAVLAGDWVLGLEELEIVQGVWWSQRLHYTDPQLQHVPPKLATELKALLEAVVSPSTTSTGNTEISSAPAIIRDVQHGKVLRIFALSKEIRELPGLARSMLGEPFNQLCLVASQHPVVTLVGAHGHHYALLLRKEHVECTVIQLNLNKDEIDAINPLSDALGSHRGAIDTVYDSGQVASEVEAADRAMSISKSSSLSAMYRQMRYLWLHIVMPVLDALGLKKGEMVTRPRLHWNPTGDFTGLPLHAAGIYEGPKEVRVSCTDYVVSSYTPTLTTLLRAQRAAQHLRRETAQIALLAEKKALDPNLSVIYGVESEIDAVASVASSRKLGKVQQLPSPVTVSQACEVMQDANIVHLACHGVQDNDHALDSGFCLASGRLKISELMNLKLKSPFLAFLSACETAKGDEKQPDQALHLAAAMMFIGFKTVVATMWAINDSDGPKVAEWFYKELFAKEIIDGDAVAYSLDTAVRKLRDSGAALDRWAPFIQMGA